METGVGLVPAYAGKISWHPLQATSKPGKVLRGHIPPPQSPLGILTTYFSLGRPKVPQVPANTCHLLTPVLWPNSEAGARHCLDRRKLWQLMALAAGRLVYM